MNKKKFINKVHKIYDSIHGNTIIKYIFEDATEIQLKELNNIYNNSNILIRWKNIDNYINNNSNLPNKFTTFWINALQHYNDI